MSKLQSILAIVCMGCTYATFAQQLPLSTQYHQNRMTINPALTGLEDYTSAAASHRTMLTGLEGSPQTSYLSLQGQVADGKMGLGLLAYHDQTGILSNTSAMVNYAYKVKFNTFASLNFGLGVGVQNFVTDFGKAKVVDQMDPVLLDGRQNRAAFNGEFGTAFLYKNLEIGVAIPQLFTNNPTINGNETELLTYNTVRHLRASAKYDFVLSRERGLTFFPMFVARSVKDAPFQWDLNGIFDLEKIGWAGVTYHSTHALAVNVGVRYKGLSIGYAQGISVGSSVAYSNRSSEILLKYQLGNRWKEQKEWNEKMEAEAKRLADESMQRQIQIDSLKNAQAEANDRLNDAEEEIEKLKNDQEQTKARLLKSEKEAERQKNTPVDQNKQPVNQENKQKAEPFFQQNENDVPLIDNSKIRKGLATDFVDENGKTPPVGYYVVTGAFGVKENADNWKRMCIQAGEPKTSIIFNSKLQVREVYIFYSAERDPAMEERITKAFQYRDIWVQELR